VTIVWFFLIGLVILMTCFWMLVALVVTWPLLLALWLVVMWRTRASCSR
jgi:hypothetical protein